jgi:hypothetical protein
MRHTTANRNIVLASSAIAAWILLFGGSASAEPCHEWEHEHRTGKATVAHLYLQNAPQEELDAAMFGLLRTEALLSSCQIPVSVARCEMIGWRLVGRFPSEYGSAVLESLLEQAGLDLTLQDRFGSGSVQDSGPRCGPPLYSD